MALPIQLAEEAGEVIQVEASADDLQEEIVVEVDESLTETTHANFLSMVRALFPEREAHRASRQQLHARCGAVMQSPIAPLNTWYTCKLIISNKSSKSVDQAVKVYNSLTFISSSSIL